MNSKVKGNAFERKVSKIISKWLTDGKEDHAVWRTDSSGGMATIMSRKKAGSNYVKQNAGDIRPIVRKGEYPILDHFFDNHCLEAKHYKKISFYPPYNGDTSSFFDAGIAQAEMTGKNPVIIMRSNNKPILYFTVIQEELPETVITIHYRGRIFYGGYLDGVVKKPYKCELKSDEL